MNHTKFIIEITNNFVCSIIYANPTILLIITAILFEINPMHHANLSRVHPLTTYSKQRPPININFHNKYTKNKN